MSDVAPPELAREAPVLTDAVMAWARRAADGAVVHVSMLDRAQTGQACGCVCVGCDAPLEAVNAGQDASHFQQPGARRMSFRHQAGMQRSDCAARAARSAILAAWLAAGQVSLPRRRVCASVSGASGALHTAHADAAGQVVAIAAHRWVDAHAALVTLSDGRQVLVTLRAQVTIESTVQAVLVIDTDDVDVASMGLEEVIARAKLLDGQRCWTRHWDDAELLVQAQRDATATAASRMDAPPQDLDLTNEPFAQPQFLEGLAPAQRGETLLHIHLKQLLAQLDVLQVPAQVVSVSYGPAGGGPVSWGSATLPAMRLRLSNARLEQHLGDVVPDVLCDAEVEGQLHEAWPLMIEVAVTHRVGREKLERIRARGTPCVEIDAGRLGAGGGLTLQQLAGVLRASTPASGGVYWVFHPQLEALVAREHERLAQTYQKDQLARDRRREQGEKLARQIEQRASQEEALQRQLWALRRRLRGLTEGALLREYLKALLERQGGAGGSWEDQHHGAYAAALRDAGYATFAEPSLQPALIQLQRVRWAGAEDTRASTLLPDVIRSLQDGLSAPSLQPYMPVVLRAVKVYCGRMLDAAQREIVRDVAHQVRRSVDAGELTFTRSLTADGALAALYPELRVLLWPGQPGTVGYANQVLAQREAFDPGQLPSDDVEDGELASVVEAALGPARMRQWTRGGGVPFEQWSRFQDACKLAPRHKRMVLLAYQAREAGRSVAEFIRSQQPRNETQTLACLEVLAGVFLLA